MRVGIALRTEGEVLLERRHPRVDSMVGRLDRGIMGYG